MLKNFTQSITFNGVSAVTTSTGEEKIIAYMNANITAAGGININQTIQNRSEYAANKETVDADYEEFRQKVGAISMQFESEGA